MSEQQRVIFEQPEHSLLTDKLEELRRYLRIYEYRHPKLAHPWLTRELTEAGAWDFFSVVWSERGHLLPEGASFAQGYVSVRV